MTDEYLSEEEDLECPLCMEEFDISDRTFKPCPCGYQICRFCYNRIVNSDTAANGCPACRRPYSEATVEFKPLSAEEWKRDQQRIQTRKNKEKERRELEAASRRHLSNMRVVQKNLVYVIGFSPKSADADLAATLRGNDYFGQYGKINKIVVNKKTHPNGQPTVGVYITYARKEDAARAIAAVDGSVNDGRVLRASYGTTKYCSAYLRQQTCQNPSCMYLHEPGEDVDSYTREDMSTIQHAAKSAEGVNANALGMRRQISTTSEEQPGLPQHASWASRPSQLAMSVQTTSEVEPKPPQPVKETVARPPMPAVYSDPILGKLFRKLTEGRYSWKIEGEEFPALFSWSPEAARKKHTRANSRYAFAEARTTPPPPGLASGIQPPGFSA
ncbi:transcriptional repressor proteinral negative regulator of transcription subunit 4 [Savitreella phatthalungensis]